jgi:5-methylcytosine-specific restriction endonuclease McrA
MEKVILLNNDYSFLNMIHWKKAMRLVSKGKVEVINVTDKVLRNLERTWELFVPKVLRLVKMVRSIYKTRVPFSKKNVFYRDLFVCQYCGKTGVRMTIDHILPSSRGGKSTFENCVTSCKPCNNKKSDKTPREAKMFPKKLPVQPTIMEFINIKMKALKIDKVLEDLWS